MITASDLQNYLNPEAATTKFLSANYSAAVTSAINDATAIVKANCNERNRRLLTTVGGLCLTRDAAGGEVTFAIPTVARNATTNAVKVWVNYCGLWRDRKLRDAVTSTNDSSSVTLATALSEGDSAIAHVPHAGTNIPQLLKSMCLTFAVHNMLMRSPRLVGPIDKELFAIELQNARDDLKSMRRGEYIIDEWAELDQVDDMETISPPGAGYTDVGW